MTRYWRRVRKFVVQKILHADDTPERIALGVGLVMFVAFLPLVGFQMVLAVGLAALLGGNKAVCVPIVWISNPVTIIPIYSVCLSVGRAVMRSGTAVDPSSDLVGLAEAEVHVFDFSSWSGLFDSVVSLGVDMWVGCTLVGLVLGLLSYFATRSYLKAYRRRHEERMAGRMARRARVAEERAKVANCGT